MIKKIIVMSMLLSTSLMQASCVPTCIQQGPNRFQPAPVLRTATRNPTTFTITVNGILSTIRRNTTYIIQFFGNPANRTVTEGADLLGQITVTTDCFGNAAFNAVLPPSQNTDPFMSATATLVLCTGQTSDTSEFSANIPIS